MKKHLFIAAIRYLISCPVTILLINVVLCTLSNSTNMLHLHVHKSELILVWTNICIIKSRVHVTSYMYFQDQLWNSIKCIYMSTMYIAILVSLINGYSKKDIDDYNVLPNTILHYFTPTCTCIYVQLTCT